MLFFYYYYYFILHELRSDWCIFGTQTHYFYFRSRIQAEIEVESLPSAATDRSLGKGSVDLRGLLMRPLLLIIAGERTLGETQLRSPWFLHSRNSTGFLLSWESNKCLLWMREIFTSLKALQLQHKRKERSMCYLAVYAHVKSLVQCYISLGAAGVCTL